MNNEIDIVLTVNEEQYPVRVEPRRTLVLSAVGIVLGLFAGFTAQGSWETWLTFRNSTEFGQADPQFGEPLGRRPRRFRLDFDWLF